MSTKHTVRAPTMDDVQDVVDLINAYEVLTEGRAYTSLGDVGASWTADNFSPATDAWLVVSSSGEIAGYGEIRRLNEAVMESDGYVHPLHQGQGVGARLVRHIEGRAQEVAASTGQPEVQLTSGLNAGDAASVQLFESHGFKPVRYFLRMRRELEETLPAPAWPSGVQVRALENADQADAVFRPTMEIFEDHWRHRSENLEDWKHRWLEGGAFDPAMWFIAEAEGEIVGLSLCKDIGGLGEVSTLGVRRPWRRRGLAMALLQHSFACFRQRGYTQAELTVDSENLTGATRLYQRAGMQEISRYVIVGKQIVTGSAPSPPQ